MDAEAADRISARARDAGVDASSTLAVGELLAVLAASKPAGNFLELGTGAGAGTIQLLSGMSESARLVTVERDLALVRIAQEEIVDERVEFVVADAGEWLESHDPAEHQYDILFADTWPGKFSHLSQALELVAPGGFYVVDDLRPQANWPSGHLANVYAVVARLESMDGWHTLRLNVGSGVMICARVA